MTFLDFLEKFPTEEHIIQHFINIRYAGNVTCNHCGSDEVVRRKDKKKVFRCAACRNDFSIFKDTMFEDTYTNLRKWIYALHLFLNGKKGISALQLQREIKGSYKTSWRMLKKIREAMGNKGDVSSQFFSIVEIDETYVGGKPRKGNDRSKKSQSESGMIVKGGLNKRGRGTKKIPVIGIVCRHTKQVHAKVALPSRGGKKLTGKQLMAVLNEVVHKSTVVMTDEFTGYNILRKEGRHVHLQVDHTKEYAQGIIHTNNIESFWATLKRGIYGIYHQVSTKHLQKYINEFCFRYNNRGTNMMDLVLFQSIYKKNS